MGRTSRLGVGLVALLMFTSGCYGPFYLTRKVHQFNGEVSDNKWVVEVVFLVCAWLPVYGIAYVADAVIFNSIEFWTGNNPMKSVDANTAPATRRIVQGQTESVFTRSGDEMRLEQFQAGQLRSAMRIRRQGEGMVAMDNDGAVLFQARTEPDGRVVISDAEGRQVTSYSREQARRMLAGVPR